MKTNLPNLIIAGTNKAGTTSLFSYLKEHPDVCTSSVKETCHFLPIRYGEPAKPVEEYYAFFKHCTGQRYILESTPGYFYGGKAIAEALKALNPAMKIIIVLREPVEKLFSFYRYHKNMMNLPLELTFDDYIGQCQAMPLSEKSRRIRDPFWGIDGGFYSTYLKQWFDVFGTDDLKVSFFDDLRDYPLEFLRTICAWLDLDAAPYHKKTRFSTENRTISYRIGFIHKLALSVNRGGERFFRAHPKIKQWLRAGYYRLNEQHFQTERMSEETRTKLMGLYQKENRDLALLLREKGYMELPAWLQ